MIMKYFGAKVVIVQFFLFVDESMTDGQTNGCTDGWSDGPMGGPSHTLTELGQRLFVEKHLVYTVSCRSMKDRPTDGPTGGPMDRQMDGHPFL